MKKTTVYLLLLAVLALGACRNQGHGQAEDKGDTLRLKYAENLVIVAHKGYTAVHLKDPWKQGHTLHTYLLVDRNDSARTGHLPPGTVVYTPVERSVVFTTAHCQLLYYLGAGGAIAGVCDLKYINIPDVQERARKGRSATTSYGPLTDCGDGMSPLIETIVDLRPQALLVSPFENSGGYGRLEQIGIPLIETADYMETSALGRAEWMRFYGLLYGCSRQADSLFAVVDSTYRQLKAQASRSRVRRSILTERKTGSTWYMPGGRSSLGQLIADANGAYAYADDRHSGSLPLAFEAVLDRAGEADVWAFKYNGDKAMTRSDLLAEYHGYTGLKAFRTGEIYECNCTTVPYFEEVSFRPDWLLAEFMRLLHPDLQDLGPLRYYQKLEE